MLLHFLLFFGELGIIFSVLDLGSTEVSPQLLFIIKSIFMNREDDLPLFFLLGLLTRILLFILKTNFLEYLLDILFLFWFVLFLLVFLFLLFGLILRCLYLFLFLFGLRIIIWIRFITEGCKHISFANFGDFLLWLLIDLISISIHYLFMFQ